MNLITVLSMGGYAHYVWPAFGLVVCALTFNIVHLNYSQKLLNLKLKNWFSRFE